MGEEGILGMNHKDQPFINQIVDIKISQSRHHFEIIESLHWGISIIV
jgi:hypothetical protein